MALRLPRFDQSIPLVEETRVPTYAFHTWWNLVAKAIEDAFAALESSVVAIQAALDAADAAQAAADAAQAAADTAQAAADTAQTVAEDAQDAVDALDIPPNGSRVVSTSGSINDLDYTLLVNASGGNVTMTLPAASSSARSYVVKKTDASANLVIVAAGGGDAINGVASLSLATQYQAIQVANDGIANWYA